MKIIKKMNGINGSHYLLISKGMRMFLQLEGDEIEWEDTISENGERQIILRKPTTNDEE